MSALKRLSVPLAIILPLFILLFSALNIQSSFEPPFLLSILNTIFIGLLPLAVTFIAGKSYLETSILSALFLSCGMFVFGLGSILAGWLRYIPDGANISVAIFNSCSLLGSIFHLLSSIREERVVRNQTSSFKKKSNLSIVSCWYVHLAYFTRYKRIFQIYSTVRDSKRIHNAAPDYIMEFHCFLFIGCDRLYKELPETEK